MTLHTIKGQLARLLATENLTVEHKKCETASFDVDTRVLSLPLWLVSNTVYDLLLGHEVGHALFTPCDAWGETAGTIPKSYINITEDVRVEKLMKRKFPGLRKDFYNGYRELNDDDFFGISDVNVDKLKLIDRINLHYKIGIVDATNPIPFTPEEQVFVDRAGAAETFNEALELARDVFEWQRDQDAQTPPETEDNTNKGTGVDSQQADSESPQSEWSEEATETQEDRQQSTPGGATSGPIKEDNLGGHDEIEEGHTDKSFEESLKHNQDQNGWNSPSYYDIPKINTNSVIVPWRQVWETADTFWSLPQYTDPGHEVYVGISFDECDSTYRQFKKSCQQEVNYLVKEFECKKSAAAYARASTSKTGVLDTQKLHNYKFSDDIFRRITITPDGKNHGLIFLLDWSGSMSNVIHDTVKQLLTLCFFCKKVGIPFSVYAFGNFFWDKNQVTSEHPHHANPGPNQFSIPENFKLAEFLSSDCNKSMFEYQCLRLFRIAYHYSRLDNRYNRYYHYVPPIPPDFSLGGTPLNEGLICLRTIIPEFQEKYGLQKVHSVILTDGESAGIGALRRSKYSKDGVMDPNLYRTACAHGATIRDKSIGYVGTPVANTAYDLTPKLLEYLDHAMPSVNIIGIRITSNRDAMNTIRYRLGDGYRQSTDRLITEFRKTKSLNVKAMGYTSFYLIQSDSLSADTEFEVTEDATKAQIRAAFKKSLKGKVTNKKILSSFISHIA